MTIKLTAALKEQFAQFLEYHHPHEFSTRLRCVILQFLSDNIKNGFPHWFDTFIWGVDDLFRLLDTAAVEIQPPGVASTVVRETRPTARKKHTTVRKKRLPRKISRREKGKKRGKVV